MLFITITLFSRRAARAALMAATCRPYGCQLPPLWLPIAAHNDNSDIASLLYYERGAIGWNDVESKLNRKHIPSLMWRTMANTSCYDSHNHILKELTVRVLFFLQIHHIIIKLLYLCRIHPKGCCFAEAWRWGIYIGKRLLTLVLDAEKLRNFQLPSKGRAQ